MTVPLVPVTIFFGLAGFFVGLRLYTRAFLTRAIGGEDILNFLAFVVSGVWWVAHVVAVKHGFGSDPTTLSPESQLVLKKAVWFGPAPWGLSSALCKLSIVWQYKRVFATPWMTRTCHALIVLLSLYGLYSFFGTIFFCVPVSAGWGEAPPDHCMNKGIFYYLCSAANIAFDITIFALPVSLIRALQIPKPQKMGLMFVFTFGALVIIVSIVRLTALKVWLSEGDTLINVENVVIWSGIDVNLSIICACLAVLRPAAARAFPHLTSYAGFSRPSRTGGVHGGFRLTRCIGQKGKSGAGGGGGVGLTTISSSCVGHKESKVVAAAAATLSSSTGTGGSPHHHHHAIGGGPEDEYVQGAYVQMDDLSDNNHHDPFVTHYSNASISSTPRMKPNRADDPVPLPPRSRRKYAHRFQNQSGDERFHTGIRIEHEIQISVADRDGSKEEIAYLPQDPQLAHTRSQEGWSA